MIAWGIWIVASFLSSKGMGASHAAQNPLLRFIRSMMPLKHEQGDHLPEPVLDNYHTARAPLTTLTIPAVTAFSPPLSKTCSLNVVNWELARVMQELSTQTKTNLILLAQPETKLTLRLAGVTLADMIRHICAITGLSWLKVGETYVIAGEDQLQKSYPKEWIALHPAAPTPATSAIVTETYTTRYVASSQIAEALKKLYGDNELTVIAGPSSSTPSVKAQETSQATGGAATGVLAKEEDTATGGRFLVIRGKQDLVAAAIDMARQMDYARPQWSISVTIHDISNDALKDTGLSWNWSNLQFQESQGSGIGFGSVTRAPLSFVATLFALETKDKAKLLASPTISALDGERAFILIGDRLSFPTLVGYTQNNTPIFNKEEVRVGIYLQVAAQVSDDKNLTLSLYPQVSAIKGFKNINGASYPDISTREAQTTLRVRSGETIVLGGMLRDEEITSLEQVPLLSQIPVFGEIFKHRKKTKVSSQVIITITPTIMPAEGQ
jgi:type II secretory pathway component GspD/PulD (secretin)